MTSTAPVADMIVAGVDTHRDTHHVAVIDQVGRPLADAQFPATTDGYRQLLVWMSGHGIAKRIGIEGTGSYGAGLSRFLAGARRDPRRLRR